LQYVISVANIECATVERFYEHTFHKNAEPLLLEFPIFRIGFVAKCESDARFSGLVRYRISSEPDSDTARAAQPGVFNPTYGADAGPEAPKGRKKSFILDPLLKSN